MKCKEKSVEVNADEEEKGNDKDNDKEQEAIPALADDRNDE